MPVYRFGATQNDVAKFILPGDRHGDTHRVCP